MLKCNTTHYEIEINRTKRLRKYYYYTTLMVEKTNVGESHGHIVLISGLDDNIILNGTTGLSNVLDTILGSTINVITEGEEGIRGKRDTSEGGEELVLLLLGKRLRLNLKVLQPLLLLDLGEVALDVSHASVNTLLSLDGRLELETKDLGVLTKVPARDLTSLGSHTKRKTSIQQA